MPLYGQSSGLPRGVHALSCFFGLHNGQLYAMFLHTV
jgi:hypothetical protein